jgi:hypothetical protein
MSGDCRLNPAKGKGRQLKPVIVVQHRMMRMLLQQWRRMLSLLWILQLESLEGVGVGIVMGVAMVVVPWMPLTMHFRGSCLTSAIVRPSRTSACGVWRRRPVFLQLLLFTLSLILMWNMTTSLDSSLMMQSSMAQRIFRSLSSSRAFSSLVPLIPPMVVVFLLEPRVALLIRTSSVVQMISLGFSTSRAPAFDPQFGQSTSADPLGKSYLVDYATDDDDDE